MFVLFGTLVQPAGGRPCQLLEEAREVLWGVEPAQVAHLLDGEVGVAEQFLGVVDADAVQVVHGRLVQVAGEEPAQVSGAHAGVAGHGFQVEVFLVVSLHEVDGFPQRLVVDLREELFFQVAVERDGQFGIEQHHLVLMEYLFLLQFMDDVPDDVGHTEVVHDADDLRLHLG